MPYSDWRTNQKLLEDVLHHLAQLHFDVVNEANKPLHATRELRRDPPHNYIVILAFPETYPRHDIHVLLQSPGLLKQWITSPIKHLTPPRMEFFKDWTQKAILEVCIRGAWNHHDFTAPDEAFNAVSEWVRDYALGEEFPDDFDLPEATFFSPTSEEQFFVDSFFLRQPFVRPNSTSFGTFKLLLSGRSCVLTRMVDFADASDPNSSLTVPRQYDLPEKDKICRNLIIQEAASIEIQGYWQWSEVPPSTFARDQHLVSLSPALEKLARATMIKAQAGMFLVAFFFMMYGRPSCIFLASKADTATLDDTFKSPLYIKPHIISDTELYARHGRSMDLAKLKEARFTILGAGALGSQVGVTLTRMGFRRFTVVDPQNLGVGNVMRHTAVLTDVGRRKVDIVARQIGTINPYAEVRPIAEDVTRQGFDFSQFAQSTVVSTIADDRAELYLNKKLCDLRVTAVYGRTTTTSYACRVIRVRPRIDACLQCLSRYAQFKDSRYVQLLDENITRDDVLFGGCTAPSFLGSNVDIGSYANLVARIAFLETGAGNQRFHSPLHGNHFVLTSRVVATEPKLQEPFKLQQQLFLPLPGCSHCGNVDLPYQCVVVTQEALEKIRTLATESGTVETGGILVGSIVDLDGRRQALVIVHATQPGPGAICQPRRFERDKDYCTSLVRQYHANTRGGLNYVGEWHSHPSTDTRPSPIDNASLYEVVINPNYTISNPISIIQSSLIEKEPRATVYTSRGERHDEPLIISPFQDLRRIFPTLIEDLDPIPDYNRHTS